MVFDVFKPAARVRMNHSDVQSTSMPSRAASATVNAERQPTPLKGKIVGVISAKGGCGASTLAINLSAMMSNSRGRTVLVDGNLQHPDVALMLGRTSQFGLLDLLTGATEPTPEAVEGCSLELGDRKFSWSLLSPPVSGEAALKTQLTDVSNCISAARSNSDYWVVDLPNHLDRHLVTMLDACDVVVVVFEETMPGVSAVRRWWNTFTQLGYDSNKVVYVMNRAGSRTNAAQAKVNQLLPAECLRVPNCFALLDDSLASGTPLVVANPKHKFSQSIKAVVAKVMESLGEESDE